MAEENRLKEIATPQRIRDLARAVHTIECYDKFSQGQDGFAALLTNCKVSYRRMVTVLIVLAKALDESAVQMVMTSARTGTFTRHRWQDSRY